MNFDRDNMLGWFAAIVILVSIIAFVAFMNANGSLPVGPALNTVDVNNIDASEAGVVKDTNIDGINFTGNATVVPGIGDTVNVNIVGGAGGSGVITPFLRNHTQGPDITEFHVAACSGGCITRTTLFTPGVSDLQAFPIYIANDGQFGNMAVHVQTAAAGGIIRLGVYEADLTDSNHIYVGALVEDYGTISAATTGFKTLSCTLCVNFSAGLYFLAYVNNDTDIDMRSISAQAQWSVNFGIDNSGTEPTAGLEIDAFGSGAFPNPFPTPGPALQSATPLGIVPWIGIQINDQ